MALRWFLTEPNVYQPLKEQASGCFAEFLGAGDLICSLVLPAGYVLLIEKVPGVTCSDEMLENPKLRTPPETRLRSAILAEECRICIWRSGQEQCHCWRSQCAGRFARFRARRSECLRSWRRKLLGSLGNHGTSVQNVVLPRALDVIADRLSCRRDDMEGIGGNVMGYARDGQWVMRGIIDGLWEGY